MTLRTKLGYGVGDLGGNLFFTVVSFHLLIFFTDTVGLSPALTGLAFTVARLWDAVTDPLMGVISDRTRTRWGRRRPYLLAGAPLLLAGIAVLFVDPGLQTPGALFAWVAIVYALVNTAYTVAFIPYNALTPDLAPGSDQRTALNGYRMTFAVIGTLIGAAGFPMLVAAFGTGATGYGRAGLITGAIVCAGLLVTFLMVREPPPPAAVPAAGGIGLRPVQQALGNRAFLLVLIPWTLHMVGISLVSPMVVFYFKYLHGDEGLSQIALGVLLIAAMARSRSGFASAGGWRSAPATTWGWSGSASACWPPRRSAIAACRSRSPSSAWPASAWPPTTCSPGRCCRMRSTPAPPLPAAVTRASTTACGPCCRKPVRRWRRCWQASP